MLWLLKKRARNGRGKVLRGSAIEASTQAERLADSIAEQVLSGEFPPGFRLDEMALAERFGVSRTPVREAIRLLASTGLIDVKPRRGASVATATSAQLETLFGAMAEIEASCARLAAVSMTPIERRRLQSRHEAMAELVAARRPRGLRRRQHRLPHPDLSRRAQRHHLRVRSRPQAAARAVPARPISDGGSDLAVSRRARRRRQGDPGVRRRGRSRGDVSSHEPGRRFVRTSRRRRPCQRRLTLFPRPAASR